MESNDRTETMNEAQDTHASITGRNNNLIMGAILIFIVIVALFLIMILIDENQPDKAKGYLEAMNDGDYDKAASYVCESLKASDFSPSAVNAAQRGRESGDFYTEYEDIECSQVQKDVVNCKYKISSYVNGIELSVNKQTEFHFEDDEICYLSSKAD